MEVQRSAAASGATPAVPDVGRFPNTPANATFFAPSPKVDFIFPSSLFTRQSTYDEGKHKEPKRMGGCGVGGGGETLCSTLQLLLHPLVPWSDKT